MWKYARYYAACCLRRCRRGIAFSPPFRLRNSLIETHFSCRFQSLPWTLRICFLILHIYKRAVCACNLAAIAAVLYDSFEREAMPYESNFILWFWMEDENNIKKKTANIYYNNRWSKEQKQKNKTMPICICTTILPVPCNLNCANYAKPRNGKHKRKVMKRRREKNHTNLMKSKNVFNVDLVSALMLTATEAAASVAIE